MLALPSFNNSTPNLQYAAEVDCAIMLRYPFLTNPDDGSRLVIETGNLEKTGRRPPRNRLRVVQTYRSSGSGLRLRCGPESFLGFRPVWGSPWFRPRPTIAGGERSVSFRGRAAPFAEAGLSRLSRSGGPALTLGVHAGNSGTWRVPWRLSQSAAETSRQAGTSSSFRRPWDAGAGPLAVPVPLSPGWVFDGCTAPPGSPSQGVRNRTKDRQPVCGSIEVAPGCSRIGHTAVHTPA